MPDYKTEKELFVESMTRFASKLSAKDRRSLIAHATYYGMSVGEYLFENHKMIVQITNDRRKMGHDGDIKWDAVLREARVSLGLPEEEIEEEYM